MNESLRQLVLEGKERLGLDQAELARRVGVGQQAVSSWERGTSRPRRHVAVVLAQVLGLEATAVLVAAGYVGASADHQPQTSIPVTPRIPSLPFGELPPDRFEDITAEIAQLLYPSGHASRFGGTGEKQFGIDVLVDGDERATFQCKRHKQFGSSNVKAAIEKVTIEAPKHHLFLSRTTATASARKEMLNHPAWELWDGDDIGRYIRSLPTETALRIVDTYFPNYREPFLGIKRPGPWLTSTEYYSPLSGNQLYTQDWTLVGRADDLAALSENVQKDPLSLLVGRGGSGKTRLLRALAERQAAEGVVVRFLQPSATVHPEDFELLPSDEKLVLIVDDAHERDDLAGLITGLRSRNQNAALLLATRPYGKSAVENDLRPVGVRLADHATVDLEELKLLDAEALAREALGADVSDALVRRLAAATLDSPIVTVVGAGLIRRGRLDPTRLEQSDELRGEIMRGFADALVSNWAFPDTELRRTVLDVVAALQPFRSADEAFQRTIAAIVGVPFDRVQQHLRSFEDAGILLRRGTSLRVVPDLLGDTILSQAAFDERSGAPTGFLVRVFAACEGDCAANVFVNANRVDWQVRHGHDDAPSLVDQLWTILQADAEQADLRGLQRILRLLRGVSYFQPERALALIEWIIAHPTDTLGENDDVLAALYPPSWTSVLHALPPLLGSIALNLDWMRPACDLLWELVQVDDRPTNRNTDHPVRILRGLAEYQAIKPVVYNEALLEVASGWFADEPTVSPFEVLEPLLETEGSSQSYDAYTLTFKPFAINSDVVMPLRNRVLQLAFEELVRDDLRRATAAAKAIEAGLQYPRGNWGRQVTIEEIAIWTPEVVKTLRQLGEVLDDRSLDPVIAVAVMQSLHRKAEYGQTEEARAAAAQAMTHLPDTAEFRLALSLHDGWGQLVRERGMSYPQMEAQRVARVRHIATELVQMGDAEARVRLLEERLSAEATAFPSGGGFPGPMVAALVEDDLALAQALIERVMIDPNGKLTPLLAVVLGRLAEQAPEQFVSSAETLLDLEEPAITHGVAQSLGWNRGLRVDLLDGELALLRKFAKHADLAVRRAAIITAQRLAEAIPDMAIEITTITDFTDSSALADEVFQIFSGSNALKWRSLTRPQQRVLLDQLVEVDDISPFWVVTFLSELSTQDVRQVVHIGQRRIEKGETLDGLHAYQPLPYHWDTPLQARADSEFIAVLRDLMDWVSRGPEGGWLRSEAGADLFRAIAGIFDQPVIAMLDEALASTAKPAVATVATLLRKAQRGLVFQEVDFVRRALKAAARHGEDLVSTMRGALYASVITGTRMGAPGHPYSEDIEQRDQSEAIAKALPHGSLERAFYTDLATSAKAQIKRQLGTHEMDEDRRQW